MVVKKDDKRTIDIRGNGGNTTSTRTNTGSAGNALSKGVNRGSAQVRQSELGKKQNKQTTLINPSTIRNGIPTDNASEISRIKKQKDREQQYSTSFFGDALRYRDKLSDLLNGGMSDYDIDRQKEAALYRAIQDDDYEYLSDLYGRMAETEKRGGDMSRYAYALRGTDASAQSLADYYSNPSAAAASDEWDTDLEYYRRHPEKLASEIESEQAANKMSWHDNYTMTGAYDNPTASYADAKSGYYNTERYNYLTQLQAALYSEKIAADRERQNMGLMGYDADGKAVVWSNDNGLNRNLASLQTMVDSGQYNSGAMAMADSAVAAAQQYYDDAMKRRSGANGAISFVYDDTDNAMADSFGKANDDVIAAKKVLERALYLQEQVYGTAPTQIYSGRNSDYNPTETDLYYRMVNGKFDMNASDVISGNYSNAKAIDTNDTISAMTDSERSTYNAIYNAYGIEKANDYLDKIFGQLQQRHGESAVNATYEQMQNSSNLESGILSAASTLLTPIKTATGLADVFKSLTGQRINTYDTAHMANRIQSAIRTGDSSKRSEVGQQLMGIINSSLDSAYNAFLFGSAVQGVGGALGAGEEALQEATGEIVSWAMGNQVVGDTIIELMDAGWDQDRAVAIGVARGAIEWATEKWSIEQILSDPNLINSFINEGAEEYVSGILNNVLDYVAANQDGVLMKYSMMIQSGYDKTTAFESVMGEIIADHALEFLAGGISGIGMGAVYEGIGAANKTMYESRAGQDIMRQFNGDVDAAREYQQGLIAEGLEMGAEGASQSQAFMDKQGKLTARQTYQQAAANEAKAAEIDSDTLKTAKVTKKTANGLEFTLPDGSTHSLDEYYSENTGMAAAQALSENVPGATILALNGAAQSFEQYKQSGGDISAEQFAMYYGIAYQSAMDGRNVNLDKIANGDIKLQRVLSAAVYDGKAVYEAKQATQSMPVSARNDLASYSWQNATKYKQFYQLGYDGYTFNEATQQVKITDKMTAEMQSAWNIGHREGAKYEAQFKQSESGRQGIKRNDGMDSGRQPAAVSAVAGTEGTEAGRIITQREAASGAVIVEGSRINLNALGVKNSTSKVFTVASIEDNAYGGKTTVVNERIEIATESGSSYVDAINAGNNVIVWANDPNMEQNRLHEEQHARMRGWTDEQIQEEFLHVFEGYSDAETTAMLIEYAGLYDDLYGSKMTLSMIMEEIICDHYGGIQRELSYAESGVKAFNRAVENQRNRSSADINKASAAQEDMSLAESRKPKNLNLPMSPKTEVKFSRARDGELSKIALESASERDMLNDVLFGRKKMTFGAVLNQAVTIRSAVAKFMNDHIEEMHLPADIEGETLHGNMSYGTSAENSTVCIRSLMQDEISKQVEREIGRKLTITENLFLAQKVAEHTSSPKCYYCYVAADRMAFDEQLGNFLKERDRVDSAIASKMSAKEVYDSLRAGRTDTNALRSRYNLWNSKHIVENAYNAGKTKEQSRSAVEHNWKKYKSREKVQTETGDTVNAEVEQFGKAVTIDMVTDLYWEACENGTIDKVLQQRDLAGVQFSDESIAEGFDKLKNDIQRHEYALAMSFAKSASHAKKRIDFRAYKGDLLAKNKKGEYIISDEVINTLNHEFGLRMYSYSDYSPAFILENMQMITDAAVRGLKMLAYTKETDFIRIFADTGINIATSTRCNIQSEKVFNRVMQSSERIKQLNEQMKTATAKQKEDIQKKLDAEWEIQKSVCDEMQGANWTEARELREKYDGVGITMVCTNDYEVAWALEQDWIDVVLPYHSVFSGGTNVGRALGYKDYKSIQADKAKKGSGTSKQRAKAGLAKEVFPTMHNNELLQYLTALKDNQLTPRFERYLIGYKDYMAGKITVEQLAEQNPYYMKLVNETRRTAADTRPVVPIFNKQAAMQSMQKMIDQGGYNPELDYLNGEYTKQRVWKSATGEIQNFQEHFVENMAAAVKSGKAVPARQYSEEVQSYTGTKASASRVTAQQDAEYMTLAKDPEKNADRLSEIVREAAARAGYKSPMLFHGTKSFGFTKIKTSGVESYSFSPFFLTTSSDMASSYSQRAGVRTVKSYQDSASKRSESYDRAKKLISDIAGIVKSDSRSTITDDSMVDYRVNNAANSQLYTIQKEGVTQENRNWHVESVYGSVLWATADYFKDDYRGEWMKEEHPEIWELAEAMVDYADSSNSLGVYSFYVNTDNLLTIDGNGRNWNRIPVDGIVPGRKFANTRDVAQYAYDDGYSGVLFRNIKDYGGAGTKSYAPSDVYTLFNPESQAKSADPVTYDDNGNIIPLSQRFNTESDDIRYSAVDSSSAIYSKYNKPITREDIDVLRSIGRKSVSQFSNADIKKAQKWAYKYYQQIGTKSPFFRAWFGEWRANDTSNVTITEIPSYTATNEARKALRATYTNLDTGWNIRVSREGETNTISHSGTGRLSEYGLAGIDNLVRNAVLLNSEIHEHHSNNATDDRITFDHKLYAIGESEVGGLALYRVTVEEQYANAKNEDEKRFHNLAYIEKVADNIGSLTHERNHGAESTSDVSTTAYTVADLFGFVKKYDRDFRSSKPVNSALLNDDGTPRKFYHGTKATFDTFEKSKLGTNTHTKISREWFFAADIDTANSYYPYGVMDTLYKQSGYEGYNPNRLRKHLIGNLYELFIHSENPLVVDVSDYDYVAHRDNADAWYEYVEEANKNNNDAIILLNAMDNQLKPRARESTVIMFRESSQAKSATDNIGTFDGSEQSTLYSAPNDEYIPDSAAEYEQRLREADENSQLSREEYFRYLKSKEAGWKEHAQWQEEQYLKDRDTILMQNRTQGMELRRQFYTGEYKTPSSSDIKSIAEGLAKKYIIGDRADIGIDDIRFMLQDVLNAQKQGQSANDRYFAAQEEAEKVASEIIDANDASTEVIESVKLIKDTLRGNRIVMPAGFTAEEKKALRAKAMHIGFFLVNYDGSTAKKSGMLSVDTIYERLNAENGGLFPDNIIGPNDMLEHILDVYASLEAASVNPFTGERAELTRMIAGDIMQQLYNSAVVSPDAYAMSQQHEDMVQSYYRQRMIETQRRTDDYVQKIKDRYAERWSKRVENQKERQQERKDRADLLKIARKMDRLHTTPDYMKAIDDIVGELDLISQRCTGKITIGEQIGGVEVPNSVRIIEERPDGRKVVDISDLKAWVDNEDANNPGFNPSRDIINRIDRVNKKHIADLDIGEVRELLHALQHIENEIATGKKLIDEQDRRDVAIMAHEIKENIRGSSGIADGIIPKVMRTIAIDPVLTPTRFFRRVTGYTDADPLYKGCLSLQQGEMDMQDYERRAREGFKQFTSDRKFMASLSGKDSRPIKFTARTNKGMREVTITPDMLISMYQHSLNKDNLRHIKYGGFEIPEYTALMKGDTETASRKSLLVKMEASEIISLCNKYLTAKEKSYALAQQRYYNQFAPSHINPVSTKLIGYEIATVKNYFPIESSRRYLGTQLDAVKGDASIEGQKNLKSRINGTNPIMLRSSSEVLDRAIGLNSKYVGLAIPVRNMSKLYGAKSWHIAATEEQQEAIDNAKKDDSGAGVDYDADSVQGALAEMWGNQATSYVEHLMTDLQTGTRKWGDEGLSAILSKIGSNYASATLMNNTSVTIKQTASYPTAAAVVGWDALGKALRDTNKVDIELIAKYTPLLWYRSKGFADNDLTFAQYSKGEGKMKIDTQMIQKADILTTTKLWKAAEYYVKAHPAEFAGRDMAHNEKVAEVYNRIILNTQPNYSTMERGALLRSDNQLLKNLSMFKTQPFQNFNILFDSIANVKAKEQQLKAAQAIKAETEIEKADAAAKIKTAQQALEQAKQNQANSISSILVSQVVFTSMQVLWNLFRGKMNRYKDDDDEMTVLSFGKRFLLDMAESGFGMIPFGSDIFQIIETQITGEKYYGLDAMTPSAISSALEALQTSGKVLEEFGAAITGTGNWRDAFIDGLDSAEAVAAIAGIPVANISNFLLACTRSTLTLATKAGIISKETANYNYGLLTEKTTANNIKAETADAIWADYRDGKNWQTKFDRYVKQASKNDSDFKKGDKTAEEARESAESAMRTKLEKSIRDGYVSGEISESEAVRALQDLCGYNTTASAENRLDDWTMERETGIKYSKLKESYLNGDITRDEAVEYKMEYGDKTRKEAEAEVLKYDMAVDTGYEYDDMKELFTDGEISASEAIKYLKKYGGLSDEAAQKKVTSWKCYIDTGIEYSELKDEFLDGNVTGSRAANMMTRYGGLSNEEAQSRLTNWQCEKDTGIAYDDIGNALKGGEISESQASQYLQAYGGKSKEDADETAMKWSYQAESGNSSAGAKEANYYYGTVRKVTKLTAEQWDKVYKDLGSIEGTDKDNDGNTDAYSLMDAIIAYIDSLNISPDAKDEILKMYYTSKAAMKRRPWR